MVPVLVADLIVNIQRDFWAMEKELTLPYVNKKKRSKTREKATQCPLDGH